MVEKLCFKGYLKSYFNVRVSDLAPDATLGANPLGLAPQFGREQDLKVPQTWRATPRRRKAQGNARVGI